LRTKAVYNVKTIFESTYSDAGDTEPLGNVTIIKTSLGSDRAATWPMFERSTVNHGTMRLFQNSTSRVYAHEIGHVLGCADHYYDNGKPLPGWAGNIMADPSGSPDGRNFYFEILPQWQFYINKPFR
jgi:hypothetical protein